VTRRPGCNQRRKNVEIKIKSVKRDKNIKNVYKRCIKCYLH